ncbi:glycosyltransferase family 2 protein [Muricauda sp. SCSIO 64092]|uniref:glycosyltransferase family 2 protein n=1 Tax=Allomuricauda sp. SCSIO 64092 TaxID=2908842 RepID=UPI001FF3F00A|nr:glycosyltransferase family 2 protein [Muricauda sp. SCSIO 64092]UOY05338.1 glycosyltransferase family 2 protein [Muricauda sp. SCSIO 64092]
MKENKKIAVVIPCYKVSRHITEVLVAVPEWIDHIIVVDDACPEGSGNMVKGLCLDKVSVICHQNNKGVGGAVLSGFRKAIEFRCDIVVKLDGDGQMCPGHIGKLIQPLLDNAADYTKGNRFHDFKALKCMPKIRLFGNSVLSFIIKAASGYWNIMDPTNGFLAISSKTLQDLNLDKIGKGYFFETDMLIHLNLVDKVVQDIPISAIYNDEISSLCIRNVVLTFPFRMMKGLIKRLLFKYYIYNFNMASIYLLVGLPLLLFGFVLGSYKWRIGAMENMENSAGTIMLAALPILLGMQFLLQAISIDIANVPKRSPSQS